jgi:hypothetical protein
MANFTHNMPDTLTIDMFHNNHHEEDEEDTTGRIQHLETVVDDVLRGQHSLRNDIGTITQQLAEIANHLKAVQAQGPLGSLQHAGPPSDTASVVSNMSSAPAHLYDTGKMCFVNSQTEHGWFVVYKKKEHLKTMYTYRGEELKCLSSAQIRSLKDAVEQEVLFGKV